VTGMKKILIWLLVAVGFTAVAASGLVYRQDMSLSDALYQSRAATNEDIIVVGIDQTAVEELGPYQSWNRDIMAQAVEYLNEDEENRPAVIVLDVLYAGETESVYDQYLVQAAELGDNVIVAVAAEINSIMVKDKDGNLVSNEDGKKLVDKNAVVAFDEPFEALKQVTKQGHINAMQDGDGVIRHHMAQLTLSDGVVIPALAVMAARQYQEYHDLPEIKMPPLSAGGFWYLNYHGLPGDYSEEISVADLVFGRRPRSYFDGKIVMIGPYTVGLQDSYFTPIDHAAQMYGVEIQANAVQSLLEGDYKREAGDFWQLVILFVLVFLGCMAFWKRPLKVAVPIWFVISAGWILICKILYQQGLVLHVLWVPGSITIMFVVSIAFNYITAAMERLQITSTFKRYVAPEIVNEILKEGTESLGLGGKLCDIAVLFVDIRGFTPMSELLEPTQVVAMLNRYLTLTSSCVAKHGGTLDKFIGDATMAIWGAPLPQEDYVMNAVKAALDMVEGSKALSEELMREYGRTLTFGIGIHHGPAVVGNIGAENRMDYTAIGDTVNTSSRLESQAPGGTIYISKAVAEILEGRIKVRELEEKLKLKGKSEAMEVFVLEGLKL